jgi:hypothetical protein
MLALVLAGPRPGQPGRRGHQGHRRQQRCRPDRDLPFGETEVERGDALQIYTVAGSDGVTQPFSVPATTPGTNPAWFVFALRNVTDKPVERWLTADRYATSARGWCGPTSMRAASSG